jgi:hypothetical protein
MNRIVETRAVKNAPSLLIRTKRKSEKLHPIEVFESLINREQALADRSRSVFSLVVYPLEQIRGVKHPLRTLEAALLRRVRSIDEIGWLKENVLAVLLPATGFKGASSFANRFARSLNGTVEALPFRVFAYPSYWYQSDKSNGNTTRS